MFLLLEKENVFTLCEQIISIIGDWGPTVLCSACELCYVYAALQEGKEESIIWLSLIKKILQDKIESIQHPSQQNYIKQNIPRLLQMVTCNQLLFYIFTFLYFTKNLASVETSLNTTNIIEATVTKYIQFVQNYQGKLDKS